jgi:hypothetical protein
LKGLTSKCSRVRRITQVKHLKGTWTRGVNKANPQPLRFWGWVGATASDEDGLAWIFHIKNPQAPNIVGHEHHIPGRCHARSVTPHVVSTNLNQIVGLITLTTFKPRSWFAIKAIICSSTSSSPRNRAGFLGRSNRYPPFDASG